MENKLIIDGTEYEMNKTENGAGVTTQPFILFNGNIWIGKAIPNKPKEKDIPKQDWEILKCTNPIDGHLHDYLDDCIDNRCTIHSVERLADRQIFTVGDETNWGKIKGFNILEDKIRCLYPVMGDWQWLSSVHKSKPKVPLFTTLKGEPIYNDDTYWYVSNTFLKYFTVANEKLSGKNLTRFLKESDADEYILLHKPIEVSYKELKEFCENNHPSYTYHHRVELFFKSKITL